MRTLLSCAQTLSCLGAIAVIILMFFIPPAEAQTPAPTGIDLHFGSDHGTSNTDNITNDSTPTFTVSGTARGATVTITATRLNSSESRTDTGSSLFGGPYPFTYNDIMSDGVWTFSATQRLSGEESVPTAPLTVTIDTTTPTVTVTNPTSQAEEAIRSRLTRQREHVFRRADEERPRLLPTAGRTPGYRKLRHGNTHLASTESYQKPPHLPLRAIRQEHR